MNILAKIMFFVLSMPVFAELSGMEKRLPDLR